MIVFKSIMNKLHIAFLTVIIGGCVGNANTGFKPFEITLKVGESHEIKGTKISFEDFRTKWTVSGVNVGVLTLRLQNGNEQEVVCRSVPGNDAELISWKNVEIIIVHINDPKKSVRLLVSPRENDEQQKL